MKILITGATGRVGRLLVDELRATHELRVLQRGVTKGALVAEDGFEVVNASLLDAEALEGAVNDVDVVCHLAALMPPAENADVFETNVRGTFNILEALRAHDFRARLVFASTDATYGTGWSKRTYLEPIGEAIEPQPTNFYGSSKVLCERMLYDYRQLYGLDYVALRFCWIFAGAEILDLFSMAMWEDVMSEDQRVQLAGSPAVPVLYEEDGTPFADHIVDARDCARAAALAAVAPQTAGETINVCGPSSFRYVDVSPRLAEALNRPLADLPLKDFHGYSFATTKAEELLGFQARYDVEAMLDGALSHSRSKDAVT
jgi:nucleoside-diphosphate-sugar epimerase